MEKSRWPITKVGSKYLATFYWDNETHHENSSPNRDSKDSKPSLVQKLNIDDSNSWKFLNRSLDGIEEGALKKENNERRVNFNDLDHDQFYIENFGSISDSSVNDSKN